MKDALNAVKHIYSVWFLLLISLSWIIRYEQTNILILITSIISIIICCFYLSLYYVFKKIDIKGNKISE